MDWRLTRIIRTLWGPGKPDRFVSFITEGLIDEVSHYLD